MEISLLRRISAFVIAPPVLMLVLSVSGCVNLEKPPRLVACSKSSEGCVDNGEQEEGGRRGDGKGGSGGRDTRGGQQGGSANPGANTGGDTVPDSRRTGFGGAGGARDAGGPEASRTSSGGAGGREVSGTGGGTAGSGGREVPGTGGGSTGGGSGGAGGGAGGGSGGAGGREVSGTGGASTGGASGAGSGGAVTGDAGRKDAADAAGPPAGDASSTNIVTFNAGIGQGLMTGVGWVALGALDAISSPTCGPGKAAITSLTPCVVTPNWSSATAICVTGSIPALGATPDHTNNWGIQVGVNAAEPNRAIGKPFSKITLNLSGTPSSGLRAMVHRYGDPDGTAYCAADITSGSAIQLTRFNTKCWDKSGVAFTAADVLMIDKVSVQVSSTNRAIAVEDLCIKSIVFEP